MIRTALLSSVRCTSTLFVRVQQPIARTIVPGFYVKPTRLPPSPKLQSHRWYSAPASLTKEEVEGRIIGILQNFDKVSDTTKVLNTSHFSNDLGLDSLDTVEVVMAIEEEFSIEIPDKEADEIHSISQAVEYILSQPDAH